MKAFADALRSGDSQKLFMLLLFVLSTSGAIGTLGYGAFSFLKKNTSADQYQSKKKELSEEEIEKIKQKVHSASLGVFAFDLKSEEDDDYQNYKMGIAQIEIVAQCDSEATCKLLKKNEDSLKDAISSVLVRITKREILSQEYKLKLREIIRARINERLPKGEVKNVFFAKFLVS